MITKAIVGVVFLYSSLSYSGGRQSGLCEEMASFSCGPGVYDDGTGTSTNIAPMKQNELANQELPKIKKRFLETLASPEGAHFRSLAVPAFGLQNSPFCNSQKSDMKKKCDEDLATGLTALAGKKLKPYDLEPFPFASDMTMSEFSKVAADHHFATVIADSERTIAAKTERPETEKKIREKIFPQIKDLLIKRIHSLDIDENTKKKMTDKLAGISYGGNDCSQLGITGLSQHFVPNAFYDPQKNTFNVCKGYLISTDSDFQFANTIGHELAHAIDPCRVPIPEDNKVANSTIELDAKYPIKGLSECLRTEKSVNALSQEDLHQHPPNGYSNSPGQGMMGGGFPSNPYSGSPPPPNTGNKMVDACSNNQIGESVSDWFAAEVTGKYIEKNYPRLTEEQWQVGISNVFRSACSKNNLMMFSQQAITPHPKTTDRIDRLLLVNPTLRKKMGCDKPHSKYVYCDPERPDEIQKLVDEDTARKKPNLEPPPFVGPPAPPVTPPTGTRSGGAQ